MLPVRMQFIAIAVITGGDAIAHLAKVREYCCILSYKGASAG